MRTLVAAALAALVVATAGCKKKDESKKAQPAAATPAPAASPTDEPDGETRKAAPSGTPRENAEAVRRLAMLPIAVEEVRSSIPLVPGGVALGPPTLAIGGRQVRTNQCVTGKTVAEVAAALAAELAKQGFTGVRQKPHPRDPSVMLVSGEKLPLRVGGSVQRGDFADCAEANGATKVSLSFFKRSAEAGEGAEEPSAP